MPSSSSIAMSHDLRQRAGLPNDIGLLVETSATASRSWAYRWRRRIGGQMGRFSSREHLPASLLLEKAAAH